MKKTNKILKVLIVLTVIFCVSLPIYAAKYKYDDQNRLIEVTYDNGTVVTYSYDGAGNILKAETSAAASKTPEPTGNSSPTPVHTPTSAAASITPGPGSGTSSVPDAGIKFTPTATQTAVSTATPTAAPALTTEPAHVTEKPDEEIPGHIIYKDAVNHWASDYIDMLSSKGIINGYPDGTIKPDGKISRAETAKILVLTLGLDTQSSRADAYTDFAGIPLWARPYIGALFERGIVKGYDDGSFRPNNEITRAEFVTMALRAYNIEPSLDKKDKFVDSYAIPSWASGYVKAAAELGILDGNPDGTFKPQDGIRRAEAFKIIVRCIEAFK